MMIMKTTLALCGLLALATRGDADHGLTTQAACSNDVAPDSLGKTAPMIASLPESPQPRRLQNEPPSSLDVCFPMETAIKQSDAPVILNYGQVCLRTIDSNNDTVHDSLQTTFYMNDSLDFWLVETQVWAGRKGALSGSDESYPMTHFGEPHLDAFPSTTSYAPAEQVRSATAVLDLGNLLDTCCLLAGVQEFWVLAHATIVGADGRIVAVWSSGDFNGDTLASVVSLSCGCIDIQEEPIVAVPPTNAATLAPSTSPTLRPTQSPSGQPSRPPSLRPSHTPTITPVSLPTFAPTRAPVRPPTPAPTKAPTTGGCGTSIRRAWHDTSCADRAEFFRALELLYKLPSINSFGLPRYSDFTRMHANSNNSVVAHGANDGPFLPWHRWYLWKFEKALQIVSGTCVTVPYWDWTTDSGREYNSTVLQPDTFGSTTGIDADYCVVEGIASMNGFWNRPTNGGTCIRRRFDNRFASFASETDVLRIIMNFQSFGRGLSGFSNNLQGAPHAVVHNWIHKTFITMFAPDDPLFWLHHSNIDRIWAIYQDYWDQDQIDKMSLSDEEYQGGRGVGMDDPLPFVFSAGRYPNFYRKDDGTLPTPRDVLHSHGDVIQVTYVNDKLGLLLSTLNSSYVTANNNTWIQRATGPIEEISCTRRLDEAEETSNVSMSNVNEILGIPEDVPAFNDIATRIMWSNLTSDGLEPRDALNTIAYRECEANGNKILASPDWMAMIGLPTELYKCFNEGEPSDCIPDITIVSSDESITYDRNPVTLLSYDETSVSFSLAQVWVPGEIDMIALQYVDSDGKEQCDMESNVFTGEIGQYNAQCVDGFAAVILYANDENLSATASAGWITEMCGAMGVSSAKTVAYSITLPCSLKGAQCTLPSASDPICDGTSDFVVASDTFESSKDAKDWAFSKIGKLGKPDKKDKSDKFGSFLNPNRGTSKTFRIPSTANNVTVALEVVELDCSQSTNVSLFVGKDAVDLGMFDCTQYDVRSFASGKIAVEISSNSETADKVVLRIPPDSYQPSGRLTIGLRNSVIGIGNVTITADCSNQLPIWEEPAVLDIIAEVSAP